MGIVIEFFLDYILPNCFQIVGSLAALYIFYFMARNTYDEYRMMQYLGFLRAGYSERHETPLPPPAVLEPGNWMRIKEAGVERIGLYLVGPVDYIPYALRPKCLEMIKSRISHVMGDYTPAVEEFENAIKVPGRDISAIKVAMKNFKVGDQYFEFQPLLDVSKDAFFTYQPLSQCCLATYLNDNGHRFLAGFSIYPDQTDFLDRNIKSHDVLIAMAQMAAEPFPHQDRAERLKHQEYKRYGRYCKKTMRWVTVDSSETAMKVRHMEYDHRKHRFMFEECCECFREAMGYKMEGSSEEDALEIPKVLHHTEKWRLFKNEKGRNVVGVASAQSHCQWIDFISVSMIWCVLKKRFEDSKKLTKTFENRLPRNVLAVAIAEEHFEVGKTYMDFRLAKGVSSSSDIPVFIHKRISEGIQATYLSENGKEYLAGITYFLMMNTGDRMIPTEKAIIHLTQMAGEPYPPSDRFTSENYLKNKRYGRCCNGQRVVVDMNEEKAMHVEYDETTHKYVKSHCLECHTDSMMHKKVEKVKEPRQKPTIKEADLVVENFNPPMPKLKPRKKGPLSKTEEHEERKENMRKTMDTMKVHLDYGTLRSKKSCKYLVKELGILVRQLRDQVDEDYTYPAPIATGNFGSLEDDSQYDDEPEYGAKPEEPVPKKKERPFKYILRHPARYEDWNENHAIEAEIVGEIPRNLKKEKPFTFDFEKWKAKLEKELAAHDAANAAAKEDGRPKNMKELSEKLRKTKDGKEMTINQIYHDFDETNPYDPNFPLASGLPVPEQQPTSSSSPSPPPQPQNRKSSESSDDFELVNEE